MSWDNLLSGWDRCQSLWTLTLNSSSSAQRVAGHMHKVVERVVSRGTWRCLKVHKLAAPRPAAAQSYLPKARWENKHWEVIATRRHTIRRNSGYSALGLAMTLTFGLWPWKYLQRLLLTWWLLLASFIND